MQLPHAGEFSKEDIDRTKISETLTDTDNLEYTVLPISVTDVSGSRFDLPSSAVIDIVGTRKTLELKASKWTMYAYMPFSGT